MNVTLVEVLTCDARLAYDDTLYTTPHTPGTSLHYIITNSTVWSREMASFSVRNIYLLVSFLRISGS